jgi:hypothetical protein
LEIALKAYRLTQRNLASMYSIITRHRETSKAKTHRFPEVFFKKASFAKHVPIYLAIFSITQFLCHIMLVV